MEEIISHTDTGTNESILCFKFIIMDEGNLSLDKRRKEILCLERVNLSDCETCLSWIHVTYYGFQE